MAEQFPIESSAISSAIVCADCRGPLNNPIQFSSCLHVLCYSCINALESSGKPKCPKCSLENPNNLHLISGIKMMLNSDSRCDKCFKAAIWNCFMCGKNFCSNCRPEHDNIREFRKHQLTLIFRPFTDLKQKIFPDISSHGDNVSEMESLDGRISASFSCPLCKQTDCRHSKALEKLQKNPDKSIGLCQIQGHTKENELKYFCLKCKKAVCGNCSREGEHKLHECIDLIEMKDYLKKSLANAVHKLNMLDKSLKFEVKKEKKAESILEEHIETTDNEIKNRKCMAIESAEKAFDEVVRQVELYGQNILQAYKKQLEKIEQLGQALNNYMGALKSLKVDDDLNILQYNHVLQCQLEVTKFIEELTDHLEQISDSQERHLVLPQVQTMPVSSLARVGTEWKHLNLAFKFKFDISVYSVHSIVIVGSEQCLLTAQMAQTDAFDAFLYYQCIKEDPKVVPFYVNKGRYMIAQTSNGEIIASFSHEESKTFSIQYSDGCFLKGNGNEQLNIKFKKIKSINNPVFGIATTKDDKIIVCYQVDQKKNVNSIMKLSLQGKVLDDDNQASDPTLCLNYVAVSDNGEIAVSDTEGSSVIILDQELKINERVNFRLPTSFCHMLQEKPSLFPFQPYGLCYDSYHRIIVADPENNSVLRMTRDYETHKYTLEPLLVKTDENPNFNKPKLVAMGNDSRLWVVCSEHIFVYEYCS